MKAAAAEVDPYRAIADGEERLAAACAAVASRLDAPDALHVVTGEHLHAARALKARRNTRWRDLQIALLAAVASSVGGEVGALVWLRKQEQRLLDHYMALEQSPTLSPLERQRLRRYLIPGAFARFARVDRLIMQRESEGAYA
ncbi:MAG TPA: hypothetical protein VIA18_17760 [Polyangia bacterium]|nr:hypothetical protein [Polyangia bacterium]HWE26809.1 hypothetical protein [Polyangia bacterium]